MFIKGGGKTEQMCVYSLITIQWDLVNKGVIIKAEAQATQIKHNLSKKLKFEFNSENIGSSIFSAVNTT